MEIEVVYASNARQMVRQLDVPEDTTVGQAIELSGLLEGVDVSLLGVGVFARPRSLDSALKPGDRVEIYRPLVMDPMTARRERAKQQKRKKSKK